jgi:hypothetical protein
LADGSQSALRASVPAARRDQVQGAALAAERFLAERRANKPPGYNYPDTWIGRLLCSPVSAIEAVIIGALLMPWPGASSL